MQEPVPKGIIQSVEQTTAQLHQEVGQALETMGHSTETVPAGEKPVFGPGDAMEAIGNTIGGHIENTLSGTEGPDKGIRVSSGRRFGRWVLDRFRRKQ
ncbi:hypothetical protein HYW41_00455 [Candidatus Daviesbacteria bacterium]|nr:hypothetical protein [Candidatus Daviesbacteria bacterium]